MDRSWGTIKPLNHLAGFDDESLWSHHVQNRAQRAVHDRVWRARTLRAASVGNFSPGSASAAAGEEGGFILWRCPAGADS